MCLNSKDIHDSYTKPPMLGLGECSLPLQISKEFRNKGKNIPIKDSGTRALPVPHHSDALVDTVGAD